MALIDGILNFEGRKENAGVFAAYPMVKTSGDTKAWYYGSPLVTVSGNALKRANVSGAVNGLNGVISDTKLYGFAATPDRDPDVGAEFPQMPQQKDAQGQVWKQVYRTETEREWQGALVSGTIASLNLIGTKCSFREQSADQFCIDPSTTSNPLIIITGVHPSDIGKAGGRVDFRVPGANSSFLTP